MRVHHDCANLTMHELVNLDIGVRYTFKHCLDIFPFHDTNNEFSSPSSNIDTNIEVHRWHCEGSKLNANICNNNYENNICLNNIEPDSSVFDNVNMECDYNTDYQFLQIFTYTRAFQ